MNRQTLLATAFILLTLTFICWSCLLVQAQNPPNGFPPSTNINCTSSTKFAIPNTDGIVSFAPGGSYANATLNGDVWDFTGLFVTDAISVLPNINGVSFSASARNCNVTITRFDVLNVNPPFPGQLDYSVIGVGTQIFNLHYSSLQLLNWTVYVDDVAKAQGDGWAVSSDGWVNVTAASSDVSIRWKEVSTIAFSEDANFAIPLWNSSINFASDGTFLGDPRLVNNTWIFQNFALAGSVSSGIPLWVFAVSAQDSNVTIDSYNPGAFAGAVNGSAWLNYTVVGVGSQNISLGYRDSNGGLGPNVYIDGENRTQGNGWFFLNDGWLAITGATSNVSIYYPPNPVLYSLPPPIPGAVKPINFLFYGTAVVAIIIIAVAIALINISRTKKVDNLNSVAS